MLNLDQNPMTEVDLENGLMINIDNDEQTEDSSQTQSPDEEDITVEEVELEVEDVRLINKAAKPPRPPRGPLLDAGDVKLMKEIAMIKRARSEHLKALRKMKKKKISSSSSSKSSNMAAMVITLLFFLVVIFQGCGGSHIAGRT